MIEKSNDYILPLFFVLVTYAQRQANTWYFGNKAGLDFNYSPPRTIYNSGLNALECCAAISDDKGKVLFYTNLISLQITQQAFFHTKNNCSNRPIECGAL